MKFSQVRPPYSGLRTGLLCFVFLLMLVVCLFVCLFLVLKHLKSLLRLEDWFALFCFPTDACCLFVCFWF